MISARLNGFALVLASVESALFVAADDPALHLGDEGVVLGVVFSQANGQRIHAFSEELRAETLTSRAANLPRAVWGSYVAIMRDQASGRLDILRDPSGWIPVYRVTSHGFEAITSDLGLVEQALGHRFQLDWDGVAQGLAYPQMRGRATGLAHVVETPAGALLTWQGGQASEQQLWSPWDFAAKAQQIDELSMGRDRLRRTLERVVGLWAETYPEALLELSGGLDSSLIGICLPKQASISAINIVTEMADGDERDYARLSAEAAGLGLLEAQVEPRADFRHARVGRFPRPSSHGYLQAIESAIEAVGRDKGAKAFFSGKGGDNVLCGISTAGPGTDALLTFGLGAEAFQTIGHLARIHGCTVWTAARLSLSKILRPTRRERPQTLFLTQDLCLTRPSHPWLQAPRGVLPGKRDHVRTLLVAHAFLDRYAHASSGPVIAPMLSQPMMEVCLRIPTWMWVDGGQNRAMARQAFANRLPERVRRRTTKGGLDGFAAAVYRAARSDLATFLADGRLAAAGLIDTPAVLRALDQETHKSAALTKLFQLADTEAWARTWD